MKKQNKIILLSMLAIILVWITIVEINNLLDGGLRDTSRGSDKSNIFSNIFGPEDEISGGSIDLDPNLSPNYALDFVFGWKSIFVFVPLMSGIIATILLSIHFILKKKQHSQQALHHNNICCNNAVFWNSNIVHVRHNSDVFATGLSLALFGSDSGTLGLSNYWL